MHLNFPFFSILNNFKYHLSPYHFLYPANSCWIFRHAFKWAHFLPTHNDIQFWPWNRLIMLIIPSKWIKDWTTKLVKASWVHEILCCPIKHICFAVTHISGNEWHKVNQSADICSKYGAQHWLSPLICILYCTYRID